MVTDRREPVAELVPLHGAADDWERLIAEGRLTRGAVERLDVEPLPLTPGSSPLSEVLDEQREERPD